MGDGWVAGGLEKIEAIDCFLITLFKINRPSLNVSRCPIRDLVDNRQRKMQRASVTTVVRRREERRKRNLQYG